MYKHTKRTKEILLWYFFAIIMKQTLINTKFVS